MGVSVRDVSEQGGHQSALDLGETVHQGLSAHRHALRRDIETGKPVQDRAGAVGWYGPIAGGEPVQRVAPRRQIVDPAGEAPFDVDERGAEPVGIGVRGESMLVRSACALTGGRGQSQGGTLAHQPSPVVSAPPSTPKPADRV
ncbi:hypothetical protein [Nonomuraea sp. NPDC003804]|uniref:hypothetical protein n=1 Tax=Nonomuraea sp. NPDC003804 TaxID=3154547 RepID=UPI0033B59690